MVTSLPAGGFGVRHLKVKKVDVELSICLGRTARRVGGMKAIKSLTGASKVTVFPKMGWMLQRQLMDIGVNGKGKCHVIILMCFMMAFLWENSKKLEFSW